MEFNQKVKQMDINAETVRPYFDIFFTKLTAEQWELLKSCKPDEATTFMLAELLLNLMMSVSNAIVKRRPRSPVSEDKVRSVLGDTLNNSLSPGSTRTSESLDKLTDLVVEEVTETVNSTLSASSICVGSDKPIPTRLISPAKVQKMICYACESLKTDELIKQLVKRQSGKQSRAISSEEQDHSDDPILASRTSSSSSSSRFSSKSGSSSEGGSTTSSVDSVKRLVQETINNSLTDIKEFFNEFNDSLTLNSSFSPEIDLALDEIIESISEESTHGNDSPDPKFSIGKGMRKINRLFIKTFATAGTLQILSQVAKKFNENPKVTSRKAIRSLIASIDAVLLEKEKPGGGNESSAFQTLKKPPSKKVIVLTKRLSDLIFSHIAPGKKSDLGSGPVKKVLVSSSHRGIYADIQTRVFCFLSLISWWLNNQVNRHTTRVSDALMTIDSSQSSLEVNSIEEKRSEQTSSSEVSSGGTKRSKQSTPTVVSSTEEKRSNSGNKRSKQSTPTVVSSTEEKRSNSGNKRSKQSTPAVISSTEERLKQTSSKNTSIEEKRSKQSTPAVVNSGGKKKSKQSTPTVISSRGKKISEQTSSSEVSSGGNKKSKQSSPVVVSSIEEKRMKQISSKVTSIEEKRSKQSTPAVVSSGGKKISEQTLSSEVSKEREKSASSDRSSREKTEKIQAEFKKKTYVSVLLDKLITRIYKKAKVTCADDDTRRHLLERIWAEIKDIDSTFIPKRSPYEAILKEFWKKWPCPQMLMFSLLGRDPELEMSISSILRRHLCKKPGFFSSFRAGISSFFKR